MGTENKKDSEMQLFGQLGTLKKAIQEEDERAKSILDKPIPKLSEFNSPEEFKDKMSEVKDALERISMRVENELIEEVESYPEDVQVLCRKVASAQARKILLDMAARGLKDKTIDAQYICPMIFKDMEPPAK